MFSEYCSRGSVWKGVVCGRGGEFSVHCTVRVHQTVRVVLGEGYSVCAGVCMGGGGGGVSVFHVLKGQVLVLHHKCRFGNILLGKATLQ